MKVGSIALIITTRDKGYNINTQSYGSAKKSENQKTTFLPKKKKNQNSVSSTIA